MGELRSLARRYIQVMRHYFAQYLAGYDMSPLLEQQRNLVAPINTVSSTMPEGFITSVIFKGFISGIMFEGFNSGTIFKGIGSGIMFEGLVNFILFQGIVSGITIFDGMLSAALYFSGV